MSQQDSSARVSRRPSRRRTRGPSSWAFRLCVGVVWPVSQLLFALHYRHGERLPTRGGVLLVAAGQVFALGVLADLIASHRVVTQRTLERVRRIELELGVAPSHYEPGDSPPERRVRELTVVDA